MGEALNRQNKEDVDREFRRTRMSRLHDERDQHGDPSRCQASNCAWKVNGRHDDPENMPMYCAGYGSALETKCAANWLTTDLSGTYGEFLDDVSQTY